jgi:hypothetical protein
MQLVGGGGSNLMILIWWDKHESRGMLGKSYLEEGTPELSRYYRNEGKIVLQWVQSYKGRTTAKHEVLGKWR